jgi:predicted TIM-barrel fold metal-dependent hydrolase
MAQRRILDGDGHVFEIEREILDFIEPPYNHEGMLAFPFFPTLDGYHRIHIATPFQGPRKRWVNARDWVDFMDLTGIESTVVYPTTGVGFGMIQDRAWAAIIARAYNNWVHHKYFRESNRIRFAALVPLQDPDEAVKEARRAVEELQAASILVVTAPSDRGYRKSLGDKSFWPLYAEIERLGVPVAVHSGVSVGWGFDYFTQFALTQNLEHPVAQMTAMTSFVMEGVLERFKRLRVAFLEAGVGWSLYMLDRMDRSFDIWKGHHDITTKPSELVLGGRVFFTFEPDEKLLPYAVKTLGSECIFWASDFPHEKTVESTQKEIEEVLELEGMTERDIENLLFRTCERFYERTPALAPA